MILQTLLQVVQEPVTGEFTDATSKLTKASIELAEASANFGALKVIFGIFLVLVLLMILGFVYQTFSMSRKVSEIHATTASCSTKLLAMSDEKNNRTVGAAQAGILIRRVFNSMAQNVKYTILRIRLENMGMRTSMESIQSRMERQINNEYTELDAFLANFECNGRSLSEYVNPQDAQAIVELIMTQIQLPSEEFHISTMDQSVGIIVNGLKLDALKNI